MSAEQSSTKPSRIDQARDVAFELLDELETQEHPIERHLLKAKRLARLLRNTDAQFWLDCEIRGYPQDFSFDRLGDCKQYAEAGGRMTVDGKYFTISLPELEARCLTDREGLLKSPGIKPSTAVAKDFVVARATAHLMVDQLKMLNTFKEAYLQHAALFASLKAAVHSYVTDTCLAIEFGDIAQNTFEASRLEVDNFIRTRCPKAAEKLIAIEERIKEDDPESRSAALMSCRRLLMTVADAVFPPLDEDWIDSSGKPRKIGRDQYKNRLLAYTQQRIESNSTITILSAEIEHLSARLDALYDKASKGVHDEVTTSEARLAVIQTYLFIAELARFSL